MTFIRNNIFTKTSLGLSSIVVLHFIILFFHSYNNNLSKKKDNTSKIKVGVFDLYNDDITWVENTLSSMPLYEKCAQVFMPAVFARNLDTSSSEFKNTLDLVSAHGIGGIVISSGRAEETATMINELQKNAKIPLLISADFENGVGMRIIGTNIFPHNMAIGATNNPDYAFQIGKAIANEASMLGVNINFAPVADINNNSENPVINLRSFSENKDAVYEFCSEFIRGSMDGGVIATAKHFPGHGNTKIDSHKDLPVISGSQEYLLDNELSPFTRLIKDGVQAIMIGHLSVPAFESANKLPSSLSYNIVSKLLKERLGFKGLIITDALDMKAVTNYFDDAKSVVKAFKAGNDILLMPPNIKLGIKALLDAVKSGEITEKRLNESVKKILAAKRWLKLYQQKREISKNLDEEIQDKQHANLAKVIAEKSVTIVKMDPSSYPLNLKSLAKVFIVNITNQKNLDKAIFNQIAKEKITLLDSVALTSESRNSEYRSALNTSRNCDLIILAGYFSLRTNGNVMPDNQIEFIKKILQINKKVIFISFENPYVLSIFPEIQNYICTYSDAPVSQQAALDLLLSSIKPSGVLPVSIPNTEYKFGYKWKPENQF
jgi:beta-N-acetylhexosaminidase